MSSTHEQEQQEYDEAMYEFSTGDYDAAITRLKSLLGSNPENFDAQLALGMAYYRKGDYDTAIVEGHKAEKLRPKEQLVHTNLSLFYMKKGDKQTAEHHGLQARIASWKDNMTPPDATKTSDDKSELSIAQPSARPVKITGKFPDMPWKKNKKIDGH